MLLLFEIAPKYSVEVQSTIPKLKKAVVCLTEKNNVLDMRQSGMTYSAVGRE